MSPALERLIRLQEIESKAAAARRRAADLPERMAALDARLAAARDALAAARDALAANQARRRTLDRDVAAAQQRLAKYKDQLMEVKTNDEYHAMQHQIAAAAAELERVEEQLLLNLIEADEMGAAVKAAEARLAGEEAAVAGERRALEAEAAELRALAERSVTERAALAAEMDRAHVELFDRIARMRQGLAVARAEAELCTACHVRLRPQVYNQVRQNETVIQCESCHRILYYVRPAVPDQASA